MASRRTDDRGRFKARLAVSAGGVVYREQDGRIDVLLLQTPGGQWGLPKGTPDNGETIEETALREAREETGLQVAIEDKIGTIEYWFVAAEERERIHKYVHFWLMRPVGGSLDRHDHEHIAVDWFPLAKAVCMVTHASSAEILRAAATLLESRAAAPEPTPATTLETVRETVREAARQEAARTGRESA